MIQTIEQIFKDGDQERIVSTIASALKGSNESPIWVTKVIPLTEAILSVLIPLRDQNLLVSPEGNSIEALTPKLFLRYCDLSNLKVLAFSLQMSNESNSLKRSRYDEAQASQYQNIDLSQLGSYLSSFSVNLEDEWQDFPIANYNLHIGVSDLIRTLIVK